MDRHITSEQSLTLEETVTSILDNINFAYPHRSFVEDRAHTLLQAIQGKAIVLKNFIKNLK